MEQKRIHVPALNSFANQYIQGGPSARQFFQYDPFEGEAFQKRWQDIQASDRFDRDQLADVIRAFMGERHVTEAVDRSLQKLRDPSSSVVIGGQQAGLLIGPLYSVHKVLSILLLAREQEAALGTPVVPVFWIAGEDHDLLEINHVYIEKNGRMEKQSFSEHIIKKKAASETVFNGEKMQQWIDGIFASFGETAHTATLYEAVQAAAAKSRTYTDFFKELTGDLFAHHGLLLIDAADPALRNMEKPFFKQLIQHNTAIAEAVDRAQLAVREAGFQPAIDAGESPAHLFLIEDGERHLLERHGYLFVSKSGASYTEEQLLTLLDASPERFSNNVVTRPLMQEWLFPTLAFIGGPGEIAYWAELQQAFEEMDLQMPPVVPRLNITLLERDVAAALESFQLSVEQAVVSGVEEERQAFLDAIRDRHLHDFVESMKQQLTEQYAHIAETAQGMHSGLAPIVEKNKQYHLRQLDVLTQKSDAVLQQTNDATLRRFDRIASSLRPDGLQERIWNVYPFLNEYGPDLIDNLLKQSFRHDGSHYVLVL